MTTGRRSLGSLQETDRENFIAIKLQIHDIGLYSYTCTLSMTFDFHPSAATATVKSATPLTGKRRAENFQIGERNQASAEMTRSATDREKIRDVSHIMIVESGEGREGEGRDGNL